MASQGNENSGAVVVFSGGQDSTTCLGWARKRYQNIYAITFDYGQRHLREIEAARKIAANAGVIEHRILSVSSLKELGGNALSGGRPGAGEVDPSNNLPNTFVPGRNLLFLTLASAWAYQLKVTDVVTGVCQTDYSGYPDCRQNTITAQELAINLGMESKIRIHTPLMWLTKAQSIELAQKEDCFSWLSDTHTCYMGMFPPCGHCAACKLRAQGFLAAGIPDPLLTK